MSFLGVAFEMAAVDQGMSKMFKRTSTLYDKMTDSVAKATDVMNKKMEDPMVRIGRRYATIKYSVEDLASKSSKAYASMKKSAHEWGNSVLGTVKKVGNGFATVGKGFGMFGKANRKVHDFFDKLQNRVMQFNVGNIASNLMGGTENLTNALEGTMTGYVQTTKPIIAELNLSSKELAKLSGKAASIAYSLNTDAGSVAETMKSLRTANDGARKSIDMLGMSEKDWVKVVQTTGVSMEDYTHIVGDLTAVWDLTPKAASQVVDNLMAIGKAANVGTGLLKNAKSMLSSIGDIFAELPPGVARSADEIQGLIESSGKMAGVFKAMGSSAEDAVANSSAVASMFAKQSVIMQKAFEIGGEGQALSDSPLFKYLTTLGLGYDTARDIIDTGSRDVVAGMKKINDVYSSLGESELIWHQQALKGLSGALGEGASGLSYIAHSTTVGTEALNKFNNMVVDGSGALKKFKNDAFSSGLTLQDTYDRAKLAFDTMVRSIARSDVVGLVGKQVAGFRDAGKAMKDLAKDKTWGRWIKTMSQFQQMGMGGIFASIAESTGMGARKASKWGAMAGSVFDTVKKVGEEIAPLAQMFAMTGPFGPLLAIGGIGALFMMDESTSREVFGPMYDKLKGFKDKALDIWDKFSGKFKTVWDKAIKPFFSGIWNDTVRPAMVSFWNNSFIPYLKEKIPELAKYIKEKAGDIWDWMTEDKGVIEKSFIGVGLAMASGVGGPMLDLATKMGNLFMVALNGPGGMVALAGIAGAAFLAKTFTSKLDAQSKVNEAFGLAQTTLALFAKNKNVQTTKKELQQMKEALAYESSTFMPNKTYEKTLKDAIKLVENLDIVKAYMKDTDPYERERERIRKEDEYFYRTRGPDNFTPNNLYDTKTYDPIVDNFGMNSMNQSVYDGGSLTANQFADGFKDAMISDGRKKAEDGLIEGVGKVTSSNSPIAEGPLSGERESNGAYRGGRFTMEQFALGIYDSNGMIRSAVESTLNDAVLDTMDVYAAKMEELAKKKTFLESVAKSIVEDLGGKIEMHTDADANVNVKKNFEAALNVPGLAGVILAISNEGAQTRMMLKRILDENIKQTSRMYGSANSSQSTNQSSTSTFSPV